ncbi:hypothetical protein C8J56DRAFT_1052850 [Mycena floridula]|nr:hypothetical protein C8J56DRAFT_1052850 [Mycena floridula]
MRRLVAAKGLVKQVAIRQCAQLTFAARLIAAAIESLELGGRFRDMRILPNFRDAMICIFTNGDLPTSAMPNVSSMEEAETLFAKLYLAIPSNPTNPLSSSQPSFLPAAPMPSPQRPGLPAASVAAPAPHVSAPSTPSHNEGKQQDREFSPIPQRSPSGSPANSGIINNYISFGSSSWGSPGPSTPSRHRIGLGTGVIPLATVSPSRSQSPVDSVTLEQSYGLDIGTVLRQYLDVHRWSMQARQTLLTMLRASEERDEFVRGMRRHGVKEDHSELLWDLYGIEPSN